MDYTQTSLTLISSRSLIDELARRHDALVVLGMKFNTKDNYAVTRFHSGHRHVCLGLMSNESSVINEIENKQLISDND